jgi:anti-anti-sigma regulatory factor
VRSDAAFALRDAVQSQNGVHVILLDLSGVSALEGGGLGMLLALQHWAYDHDIRLKLFNPTKSVYERLTVANSLPALEVVTSDEVRAIISGARLRAAA